MLLILAYLLPYYEAFVILFLGGGNKCQTLNQLAGKVLGLRRNGLMLKGKRLNVRLSGFRFIWLTKYWRSHTRNIRRIYRHKFKSLRGSAKSSERRVEGDASEYKKKNHCLKSRQVTAVGQISLQQSENLSQFIT